MYIYNNNMDDINKKLSIIISKLIDIDKRLCIIEEEVKQVSKHVPFVDNLAESGVVSAVQSVNMIISSINPYKYINNNIDDSKSIEDL